MNKPLECQPELTQFGGPPVFERQWVGALHEYIRVGVSKVVFFYSSRIFDIPVELANAYKVE